MYPFKFFTAFLFLKAVRLTHTAAYTEVLKNNAEHVAFRAALCLKSKRVVFTIKPSPLEHPGNWK